MRCVLLLPSGAISLGDEKYRRKMLSARAVGKSASFLSVIETYENTAKITKAMAASADEIHVELADGRVQIIKLTDFDGDGDRFVRTRPRVRRGRDNNPSRNGCGG